MTSTKYKKSASRKKDTRAESQQPARPAQARGRSVDCCDLKIAAADATRDEDLPAAEGGIA